MVPNKEQILTILNAVRAMNVFEGTINTYKETDSEANLLKQLENTAKVDLLADDIAATELPEAGKLPRSVAVLLTSFGLGPWQKDASILSRIPKPEVPAEEPKSEIKVGYAPPVDEALVEAKKKKSKVTKKVSLQTESVLPETKDTAAAPDTEAKVNPNPISETGFNSEAFMSLLKRATLNGVLSEVALEIKDNTATIKVRDDNVFIYTSAHMGVCPDMHVGLSDIPAIIKYIGLYKHAEPTFTITDKNITVKYGKESKFTITNLNPEDVKTATNNLDKSAMSTSPLYIELTEEIVEKILNHCKALKPSGVMFILNERAEIFLSSTDMNAHFQYKLGSVEYVGKDRHTFRISKEDILPALSLLDFSAGQIPYLVFDIPQEGVDGGLGVTLSQDADNFFGFVCEQ